MVYMYALPRRRYAAVDKLCLASGEIMALPAHVWPLFETADFAVASPATVSRLGSARSTTETPFLRLPAHAALPLERAA